MLRTVIDEEVLEQAATQRTLGQHALDSVAEDAVHTVGALAQLFRCVETLTTWIASIACVDLVGLLLASEDGLLGIDDDNVVTTVYVRCEVGFVLSANQLCYL